MKVRISRPFVYLSALATLGLATLSGRAQFVPLTLTPDSFTHDVVVEKTAPPPLPRGFYTTASMDGGTNNNGDTWNERGYFSAQPDVGLPKQGTIMTSLADANHQYLFAPDYKTNNAIMLDANPVFTNATVTLTAPGSYTGLSFLTSGGNGGCIFRYTVHHADGTTEVGQTPSADWFNGANPAWIANGRVNAQTYTLDNFGSNNPRLYSKDVTLTNPSPITRIDLAYVSSAAGAHTCIMAISGQATPGAAFLPIPITGYNADIVVEETAPERAALTGVTTASYDGGLANTGNTVYEAGYAFNAATTGLPAAGSTITNAAATNHTYVLAPSYTANNAVYLSGESPNAVLTPASPAPLFGLSFLGSSAAGASPIDYVVTHADGSTETGQISLPDWFDATPVALNLNGRVDLGSSVLDNVNGNNPRLYAVDIGLNNLTSPVTRIDLNYVGTTSRAFLFAVSGSTGPLPPSFLQQPGPAKLHPGDTATFTASATGTAPITYQYQRGANGVFTNLSDAGNISGSQTATLTVANATASDAFDYRLIASNAAGSATSSVVSLTVLSALPVITTPTDSVTGFGGTWPDAESPAQAFDGTTSKYLNRGATGGANPFTGPVGFVVTPSQGRTILGAVRFYTANDAADRDPIDYKIEGSNDGGGNYTLVAQGPLNLPTARNNGGLGLDPANQAVQQVVLTNSAAYSTYRVTFTNVRNPANGLFQIGEVEMLGNVDTSGTPFFSQQPVNSVGQVNGSVQLTAAASGTPVPSLRWYRVANGVFTALSDSGTVSGSASGTLTLSSLSSAAAGQYAVVASNSAGSATSSVVNVTIISDLEDVTAPGDVVEAYGDESNGFHTTAAEPANAIDDNTGKYINGGSGFSAAAGFPPFAGPAGLIVTPSVGSTIVKGIRIYTGDDAPERDPVNYTLEGSNDGTTFTVISSGPLAPGATRNAVGNPINPLTQGVQEVLFNNSSAYTTYRLSFNNVRNDNTANSVQVAEIELLGQPGTSGPTLSISKTGANITITWAGGGTLEYITDLNQAANPASWVSTGNNTGTYTEATSATMRFFRVRQ